MHFIWYYVTLFEAWVWPSIQQSKDVYAPHRIAWDLSAARAYGHIECPVRVYECVSFSAQCTRFAPEWTFNTATEYPNTICLKMGISDRTQAMHSIIPWIALHPICIDFWILLAEWLAILCFSFFISHFQSRIFMWLIYSS